MEVLTSKFQDTFNYLIKNGYPTGTVLMFLLDQSGYSLSRIARETKFSVSLVSYVVSGERSNENIRNAVRHILKFDPWEN